MKRQVLLVAVLLVISAVFVARAAFAADPLEVAPDMYKLITENDRVRVMQVTFQVGEQIAEHSHPDHFAYVLEAGNIKITKADGTVTDAVLNVGDVVWIDAETHSAVNTGTTPVRLLIVELKEPKPATEAPEAASAQ
ncbi:MAG TPA: cupin domain-containing protein [Candidatus Omnitrophota bacterium]|nr:cupin domain-containing protein [Candidatus Omnitrophota bacterium]